MADDENNEDRSMQQKEEGTVVKAATKEGSNDANAEENLAESQDVTNMCTKPSEQEDDTAAEEVVSREKIEKGEACIPPNFSVAEDESGGDEDDDVSAASDDCISGEKKHRARDNGSMEGLKEANHEQDGDGSEEGGDIVGSTAGAQENEGGKAATDKASDGVIENLEDVKKDGKKKRKIYSASFVNARDVSNLDDHSYDTYDSDWGFGRDEFHIEIAERLQSKYRMHPETHHKLLSKFVDTIFPEELKVVLRLLVVAEAFFFPMTCDYNDSYHDQILDFLESWLDTMHIFLEGDDDEDWPSTQKQHVNYIAIDNESLNDVENYDREQGIRYWGNEFFEIDECIEQLTELNVLRFSTHCTRLPSELSNMKKLRRINIVDWCANANPVKSSDSFPLVLPHVNMINIETCLPESTTLKGVSRELLLHASFPSFQELNIEVHNDATQIVTDVVEMIKSNYSLRNTSIVWLQFGSHRHRNTDKNMIPNLFLNILPNIFHLCPKLEDLTFSGDEEQLEGVVDSIANRLRQGEYDKRHMPSMRDKLSSLEFDFGTNMHAKKQKTSMVTMLKWFRNLTLIPRAFGRDGDEGSQADFDIEYLVRINDGGGRFLLPHTELNSSHGEHGEEVFESAFHAIDQPNDQKAVPISLWPSILERADNIVGGWSDYGDGAYKYPQRTPSCTAIYQMLRPNSNLLGPALESILQGPPPVSSNTRKRKFNGHEEDTCTVGTQTEEVSFLEMQEMLFTMRRTYEETRALLESQRRNVLDRSSQTQDETAQQQG